MSRPPRFTPAGYPLHLVQRGNYRQETFLCDEDRREFLELLGPHALERRVRIAGYCLMSNHFHLLAVADDDEGASAMMQCLESEYSRALNQRHRVSGHLWQGRFRSSVMDEAHFRVGLAYAEGNPVRAGMVSHAAEYAVLGPKEFVQTLEQQCHRTLTRKPPGRPRKTHTQSTAIGA